MRQPWSPRRERVRSAAETLEVTIAVHKGSSTFLPTLGMDRYLNPFLLHAVSHPFEQMLAFATLVVSGVMERHPHLHFAFLESGAGWAPYWLWRLDEQVHSFGGCARDMRRRPSEYFRRQCWVAVEADEPDLPRLIEVVGTDRILWGLDYPHHDATFPGAVAALDRSLAAVPATSAEAIRATNARACYRLGDATA